MRYDAEQEAIQEFWKKESSEGKAIQPPKKKTSWRNKNFRKALRRWENRALNRPY